MSESKEQLLGENKRLREENARLRQEVERLSSLIEELERRLARPAAPFRVRESRKVKEPRKPGRKKGHEAAWRQPPASEEQIDQTVQAPLGGERCPHCGASHGFDHPREHERFVDEVVPAQARRIRVLTHSGQCRGCGKRVESAHPLQTSAAGGAARTSLGPRAQASLLTLGDLGLSVRKTARAAKEFLGLSVSPGAISQLRQRMARKLEPQYQGLVEEARAADHLHVDETSWWVGGPGHWLWVFCNDDLTVYRIAPGRSRQQLLETLGQGFGGVLVSDCLSVYDGVNERQQKCYAHHLKAIAQAQEQLQGGGGGEVLSQLRAALQAAMALKAARPELGDQEFAQMRASLEKTFDQLLDGGCAARAGPQPQLEELKVLARIRKQRDHLLEFLDHPRVEATNNQAERQLRPAVIARKVSCGNKTSAGARAQEILMSLAATARQRGESFLLLCQRAARLVPA
jgi:transposase